MKTTYWKCPHHEFSVRTNPKQGKTKEEQEKEKTTFKMIFGCIHPIDPPPPGSINLCRLPLNYNGKPEECPKPEIS